MKKILTVLGTIITLATVFGLGWKLEIRWNQSTACADNDCQIKLERARLEQKIQGDNKRNIQQQMVDLNKEFPNGMPDAVANMYRELSDDYTLANVEYQKANKERCE